MGMSNVRGWKRGFRETIGLARVSPYLFLSISTIDQITDFMFSLFCVIVSA
ncbi:MAG: hypothetical protein BAJATHORv1_80031 [Candidatus Thorarchaeota archaeon]|nr:MAG: hypothetical protein BAJATHORv1_80031 [Candidatus Thorarchaeota archaeon]